MLAKVYAEKPLRDYAKVIKYADELAADGFDLVEDFSDLWAYDTEKKDCRVRNTKEDRKSTRLNSSHIEESRMPSSA